MLIDPYRFQPDAPPEPEYPFVSIGSTQPYRAVHMGPCVTTDNAVAPWPVIYFDNCVMQEGT